MFATMVMSVLAVLFVTFVVMFVIMVGMGKMGWLGKGPDYSHEVEGKFLDTSDNKWKTAEQIELDRQNREARDIAYQTRLTNIG